MKKIILICFLFLLFPKIVSAQSVSFDIPLFPEFPQGKLITGEDGESYFAITFEEYSKMADVYKGMYKLKMDLINAENTIDFLNKKNKQLNFDLTKEMYKNWDLIDLRYRENKRHVATTILISLSTGIASVFLGAAVERSSK